MRRTLFSLLVAGAATLALAACDTPGSDAPGGTAGSSGLTTPPISSSGSSDVPPYADPADTMGVSPPYSPERNPSGNSRG